jgi:catechol 2,3-dioxygenase-like lactoylglutathione lyase family enzyme
MFSHVTVGANDVVKAAKFYDALFAPLGITRFWTNDDGSFVGWKSGDLAGHFFVGTPFNGQAATTGNGCMCAFTASSRQVVDLAYAAAMANGGSDEGPPGPRPQYTPGYYGAYMRDPEGNKLHVVYRQPS